MFTDLRYDWLICALGLKRALDPKISTGRAAKMGMFKKKNLSGDSIYGQQQTGGLHPLVMLLS